MDAKRLVIAVAMVVCASVPGFAQTSQLSGFLTDTQQLRVSQAHVVLTAPATGVRRETSSDERGYYAFPGLEPGTFELEVTKDQFAALRRNVTLNAGQRYELNLTLSMAGVQEALTVEAGTPQVAGGAVATVIQPNLVQSLPLNGRNFLQLLELTPGTVLVPVQFGSEGQFVVNGQRASANYVTVDGVSANTFMTSSSYLNQSASGALPNVSTTGSMSSVAMVESLEEVRVQTSTFSAEYGRAPGGQVSVVTKSGSNATTGSAAYFLRDDALDAKNWFTNAQALPKPKLRQDTFAGTLGGPLRHNQTFYFFSAESNVIDQPVTGVESVPSASFRSQLPAILQTLAGPYPQANGNDLSPTQAEYRYAYSDKNKSRSVAIRLDEMLGDASRLFGRFSYAPSSADKRNVFSPTSAQVSNAAFTSGVNLTLGPDALGEVRFNYTRATAANLFHLLPMDGVTIPDNSLMFPAGYGPANASFSFGLPGLRAYLAGRQADNEQRQVNVLGSYTLVRATHLLKAGVDYRLLLPVFGPRAFGEDVRVFNANDALAGRASFASISSTQGASLRFHNVSLFAQDDWQVKRSTTISYGVRVEINPSPSIDANVAELTPNSIADPSAITLSGSRSSFYSGQGVGIAPRLGFSHVLMGDGRLIARGGVGLFYDTGQQAIGGIVGNSYPFTASRLVFGETLPLPAADLTPPPQDPTAGYQTYTITVIDPNLKLPRSVQYNAGVEWRAGRIGSLSATYVGARNDRLLRTTYYQDYNATIPYVAIVRSAGESRYNALQLQFRAHPRPRTSVLVSYALSKSTDDGSNESTQLPPDNIVGHDFLRGPSDYDVRHTLSVGVATMLPEPSRLKPLLGGWSVDALLRARSALPMTVIQYADPLNIGLYTVARPDLVPGVSPYLDDPKAPGGWRLNPDAFTLPASGPGSEGRNVLRGFPAWELDAALTRRIPTGHVGHAELRLEVFNVLNSPQFADPETRLSNAQFGRSSQILAQVLGGTGISGFTPLYQFGGPRSMQMVFRFRF